MIIISGCGRSGTSAVARLLYDSGVSVGRDLIPPDEGNAEGYYEERAVVELNDEIVQTAGLGAFFATASREHMLACARPLVERMRELAAEATPAWKDPRFCWTLEAWLDAFDAAPRVVVCLRNPSEVIASTMRYFGMSNDDEGRRAVAHVWRSENERLLAIIQAHALEATCVEYDDLLADPAAVAARLAAFIGQPLRAAGVRADLRHHRAALPDELANL
ncbi:MAG: sulfotransferase [Dehalococcoidia bacterium]